MRRAEQRANRMPALHAVLPCNRWLLAAVSAETHER